MKSTLDEFEPPVTRALARKAMIEHMRKLEVGTRLPPIRDLARELGVGTSSLHQAVRDLAREGHVYSRPRLGTFVADRSRRPRRSPPMEIDLTGRRIAFAAHHGADGMIQAMIAAATEELADRGAAIVRVDLADQPDALSANDTHFDLAILFNPHRDSATAMRTIPTVVASTSWHRRTIMPMQCDLVSVDQEGGAYLAGKLLRECGFKAVCIAGYRDPANLSAFQPTTQVRITGFEAGFGKAVPAKQIVDSEGYSICAGGRALRRYLEMKSRPAAIFAVTDEIALGFLAAAEGAGMTAGQDYHLIGFDGQLMGRMLPAGPLTTVAVPADAMGRAAGRMAIERLVNPNRPLQTTSLACSLIRGRTVRPDLISPDATTSKE